MITFRNWLDDLNAIEDEEEKIFFVVETLRPKSMLHIFGRYFFPHIIRGTDEAPDAHIELIDELTRRRDSAIVYPRGFAKTTWEKIDTLHDIVYRLEPVILYISAVMDDAKFHFESIKMELENNDDLRRVYGSLVPAGWQLSKKWTNKHFETTNGVNVVARGAGRGRGVNIKNQRPTKIVLDDIETDDGVRSPEQREKLHDWLHRVILPAKDKERGFIKMIGTILSTTCELLKFYKGHGGIFRKAIEDGKSIWPTYWPTEDLYKIRDGFTDEDGQFILGLGTRVFSQEYLNTPINEDTARIKPQWVEKGYYQNIETPNRLRKIIILDPQAGESKKSDKYGLAVLGYFEKDPHRYLLEISEGKASQLEQAALLVRTFQRHPSAHLVGVEKVLNQVAVYQLVCDWKAGKIELPDVDNTNRNIPIMAVSPEGKDKLARMEMHEPSFERGLIHLHHTMRTFGEKLIAFPDVENDDDIDAFVYCLEWSYKSGIALTSGSQYNKGKTISGDLMSAKF